MLQPKQFTSSCASGKWTAPGALFLALLAVLPGTGNAQTDAPSVKPASAPVVSPHPYVNTMASPKGITPNEVMTGSASLQGPLDGAQKLRLVIALFPPNLEKENKFLADLQTKGSPAFGKFLTANEWNKRFAPTPAQEKAVVDWAVSQGFTITNRYSNRLLVDVEAPVATIEQAFGLKINNYLMADGKQRFSADGDPVVPSSLLGIVQNVQGLNNMRVLHPMHKGAVTPDFPIYTSGPAAGKPSAASAHASGPKPASLTGKKSAKPPITNGAYDPTDIYSSQAYDVSALYNQGHCCNPFGNSGGSPKETTIAIATAGSQDWNDIAGFHNQYSYLAYNMLQIPIDGTTVPCNPATMSCDGEGTMDAEWSTAMSNSFGSLFNTSSVFLYDGVDAGFGTFDDIYNRILSDNSTRIMSTSWGCEEIVCYDGTDMNTTDGIFASMVGQGWTLVAASGDQGATAGCGAADAVQFPSSDPNVVGAGGTTMYLDGSGNFVSQTAWTGGPYGCGSNDGGSTGGVSSWWGVPGFQSGLGYGSRAVPDLALNADWYNTPQNFFFGGSLSGNGGTSIVAPELAGMFAQFNAYLLTLGNNCLNEGGPCAPMGGLVNPMVYWLAENPSYAPHYAFYDITTGCNNNDVTSFYGLGYYCAGTGYDPVTGWGSFNALQLAWGINTYRAGDFGDPVVSFTGPTTSHWYNTDQTVSWTVADTSGLTGYAPNGVAGFSQAWDSDPGDPTSEATPGSGNSFYSGPQFPNATSGYLNVSWIGQGCHTANVRPWDNSGFSIDATYGPVCYDITPPVSKIALKGTKQGSIFITPVTVSMSATDSLSGVSSISYTDISGAHTYTAPFKEGTTGPQSITYHSTDVAGNVEAVRTVSFTIESPTKTVLTSSVNPSKKGQQISFYAVVTTSFGGAASGTVQFKDGTKLLATRTLNTTTHQTRYQTSGLAVGSHNITAVYLTNGHDLASTSNVVVQVVTK